MAHLGFALGLRRGAHSLIIAVMAGLAFGTFMAAADATVLADAVPRVQRLILASLDLRARLTHGLMGAAFDEVLLRLVVLVPLLWALAVLRGGRADAMAWRTAIVLVAFVAFPLSVMAYLRGLDWSALTAVREAVLHGGAGVVWGWLCWRHGWLAGLAGHMAAHLALQPLLGIWG